VASILTSTHTSLAAAVAAASPHQARAAAPAASFHQSVQLPHRAVATAVCCTVLAATFLHLHSAALWLMQQLPLQLVHAKCACVPFMTPASNWRRALSATYPKPHQKMTGPDGTQR